MNHSLTLRNRHGHHLVSLSLHDDSLLLVVATERPAHLRPGPGMYLRVTGNGLHLMASAMNRRARVFLGRAPGRPAGAPRLSLVRTTGHTEASREVGHDDLTVS